jgi:DNA-binding XRE family transcriptional regulator
MLRQIGENVHTGRLKANLTQECLAELVGVHWQTISHIENGRFHFSIVTFARIAQALAASPKQLLEGMSEPDFGRMEAVKKALSRKRKPKQNQLRRKF